MASVVRKMRRKMCVIQDPNDIGAWWKHWSQHRRAVRWRNLFKRKPRSMFGL